MGPGNDEARLPASPGTINNPNHTPIVSDLDADRKKYETLRAHLAFKAISLHELADGGYLIASAFNTLHCPSLHEVKAFCQRAGVSV